MSAYRRFDCTNIQGNEEMYGSPKGELLADIVKGKDFYAVYQPLFGTRSLDVKMIYHS